MPVSVICLSHTDGAGGAEIGKLVAERLGFRHVDDDVLVTAANAAGLYPEAVAEAEQRGVGRRVEVDFHRFEPTENLRELIREAIVAEADEGRVVIVAHAASYALAARDDVLRVLVTASEETRLERLRAGDGLDEKAAAKLLRDADKNRGAYLKQFYDVDRERPTDYDLVLNTDRISTAQAAEAIARTTQ
jgi:cytidylate kinase